MHLKKLILVGIVLVYNLTYELTMERKEVLRVLRCGFCITYMHVSMYIIHEHVNNSVFTYKYVL